MPKHATGKYPGSSNRRVTGMCFSKSATREGAIFCAALTLICVKYLVQTTCVEKQTVTSVGFSTTSTIPVVHSESEDGMIKCGLRWIGNNSALLTISCGNRVNNNWKQTDGHRSRDDSTRALHSSSEHQHQSGQQKGTIQQSHKATKVEFAWHKICFSGS